VNGAAIQTVTDEERDRVLSSLALGFAADPLMRWLFQEATAYLKAATGEFYNAFGGGAIEHNTAYRTAGFEGAALWYPPGTGPDETRLVQAMASLVEEQTLIDGAGLLEGMASYHPQEPCWYLAVIGVDIGYQEKGHGAQLMKHALRIIDEQHLPAYLESSNPRNLSLYKRHGFEEMGVIQSGSSPAIVPMLREAR